MSAKFPTIFSFPGSQHRLKFSSDIAAAPCILLCFSYYIMAGKSANVVFSAKEQRSRMARRNKGLRGIL